MILALALIFGLPSIAYLLWGAYLAWKQQQREKRAAAIRADLRRAEAVRIDSLRVLCARRGPDLPSIKRTVR